jgi:hypothetical protein
VRNIALVLLAACTMSVPLALQAQSSYTIEVTVANGPHADTFTVHPSQLCNRVTEDMPLSFDQNLEGAYDLAASQRALIDPKSLNSVLLQVYGWDGKTPPSLGRAMLVFGPTKDGKATSGTSTRYEVDITANVKIGVVAISYAGASFGVLTGATGITGSMAPPTQALGHGMAEGIAFS